SLSLSLSLPPSLSLTPTALVNVSRFSVKGSAVPLRVLLGADATLPCQVFPPQSVAHMHIRWYHTQLSRAVLVFQNGQEQRQEQMPEYQGRTRMLGDAIAKGSVTLLIQQVRASDSGQYWCHFTDGATSQGASVELHVIGLGSAPRVRMTGLEENGIRVLCSSSGWFPKPKVQWRDSAGVTLPSPAESQTQDSNGLFHVETSLVVTDETLGSVTCSVQNLLYGQEKASAILLPEPFFPRASPWKVALIWTLPLLTLLLLGAIYVGWRDHKANKREIKEKEKESNRTDQIKKDMELAQQTKGRLWDWKKAWLYPAPVSIYRGALHQDNPDPKAEENRREETREDTNLITLHQEGFVWGRWYWEVDVGNTEEWALGVYELSTFGDISLNKSSEKKFSVLEKKGDTYRALTFCSNNISQEECLWVENHPQKVAIFLDDIDDDLSFYNMTDDTHIFSFSQACFPLSLLYPYFTCKPLDFSSQP
uniref:Butyrophilin-like 1 n=1 Tax=Nannospalax galili TaxID=1026970 RepID=A0A8C6QXG9_NANGA